MSDVLIVDDETNVRSMVGLILERAGIASRSAATGAQALAAAEAAWPGVVLLDLTLADEDGWQIWETLAECAQGRPLKVILFGAALDGYDRAEAERRGAVAVLPKTVAPRILAYTVRRALEA